MKIVIDRLRKIELDEPYPRKYAFRAQGICFDASGFCSDKVFPVSRVSVRSEQIVHSMALRFDQINVFYRELCTDCLQLHRPIDSPLFVTVAPKTLSPIRIAPNRLISALCIASLIVQSAYCTLSRLPRNVS